MNENKHIKLDDFKYGLPYRGHCNNDCSDSSGFWDTAKNYVILAVGMIILALTLIIDDNLGE